MPFRVSGKNIEVGEALRERIGARVHEALEKYFDGGYSGHVTVGKEAFGFCTECVVHLDSGIVLRADSMAADAYLSADQAAENLEKRLRRYHRRLKDYHAANRHNGRGDEQRAPIAAPSYVIAAPEHEDRGRGRGIQPGDHRRGDHRVQTAVGQRSGDRTRHDRRTGRAVPPRRPRSDQPRVSPVGRQRRLDRSAGQPGRRPLTARETILMVRRLSASPR